MSEIQKVIEQNNFAADHVMTAEGPVDDQTAELVLRNTAVAADRLNPYQFSKLGESATAAMLHAAAAAKEIAPLREVDNEQLPTETDAEHRYRTEVWQPLHNLQSVVSVGTEIDMTNPDTARAVKQAVWLGSVAFEKVVQDPAAQEFSQLQGTTRYFGGNAHAAAGRAERQQTAAV
jgi:hypothetical protein